VSQIPKPFKIHVTRLNTNSELRTEEEELILYSDYAQLQADRDALRDALELLLYHTEMRGDANKFLAVGKAQKALTQSKDGE
jgi:hypothetical protein